MRGSNKILQPIPYQGSKRRIASTILNYCPSNIKRFVEPFAGSAAVSLLAAYRNRADSFWLNDAHKPLINLWSKILYQPDILAKEYSSLWYSQQGRQREFYNEVRDRFNKNHDPADFLYLLARCVKAAIRYNSNGDFNNTPDNRRLGAKPDEMARRIFGASQLLSSHTKLTALDYKQIIKNCKQSDFLYMDPPYQGVCGNRDQRYATKIHHDEFCAQLNLLNHRNIMYIVSYDGRLDDKQYGKRLPSELGLKHLEIPMGRSTQATLLGRNCITYESLYVSPAIKQHVPNQNELIKQTQFAFV